MTYIVSGSGMHGPLKATRLIAASAGLLAKKWVADGACNVKVVDEEGRTFSREELLLAAKRKRPIARI